jgi:dipeptide/tripeptide permease
MLMEISKPVLLLASLENIRGFSLVLGVMGIAAGIVLFAAHQRSFDVATRNETDERLRRFETRKFRRRATVASMVASVGCLMAALNWVAEARVFSIFILLILSLLLGILGIAMFDMFSVSLRALTRDDDETRKKIVEEVLRRRQQSGMDDSDETQV